jgi:hypothetical protein
MERKDVGTMGCLVDRKLYLYVCWGHKAQQGGADEAFYKALSKHKTQTEN